ncbi:MAG: CapA family protein [Oscillospiraceae bacterium]|nr:CapA family protein [Oscillospiraceae bacterium]
MKYRFRQCAVLLAALMLLSSAGCGGKEKTVSDGDENLTVIGVSEAESAAVSETEPETEPPTEAEQRLSFAAVGDNLIHTAVYRTAAEHAENGKEYDFHYCYSHVADKIKNADLAFINQETVICNGEFEVSGSNLNFNSPMELGDDLIDIGFDIINMANNHVLDKGSSGMRACLDYWDAQCEKHDNVRVLGAYRDYQDMYDYRITEANGITVGILGYTEHTNGYSLPGDSQMRIPYLYDRELMEKQVRELDSLVDCVVVSTHWGVEDTHIVTDEMKSLSQDLIDWGADVIIGTGPHTLESMEYLSRGDGTQGFVYYSLGNFISGQTDNFNMVGGMALFDIVKKDGVTSIENPKLTPLINQYETGKLRDVRVIPYYEYTDELVQSHGIPDSPMGSAKSWSWDVINTIIENNVPEEYRQLEE